MGRVSETDDEDVVRLFPDNADTVIWFSGPVSYEEAHLSEVLSAAMKAWEHFFNAHEVSSHYVVDAASMPYYRDEGIRLARGLANEIGSQFVVEFDPDERNPAPRRFRAAGPATNSAAARVFSELAADNARDLHGDWTMDLG